VHKSSYVKAQRCTYVGVPHRPTELHRCSSLTQTHTEALSRGYKPALASKEGEPAGGPISRTGDGIPVELTSSIRT
jgi:hypothetical protein